MSGIYTPEELAAARKYHDVTPNGVAFAWWLAGPAGAGFALMREPHQTDADIDEAGAYLRRERDVVGSIKIWKNASANRNE
jgi:hypothetical protein